MQVKSIPTRTRPQNVGDVTAVVIGAGHAGLAVSHCLDQRGIDHVILERGEVANSWRRERWDSLKLLTPNWQCRLPGQAYEGDQPDGFMGMTELVDFISRYGQSMNAPLYTHTRVSSLSKTEDGYRVQTNRGTWRCRSVVIASGAFNTPALPRCASALPASIKTYTPQDYRSPSPVPDGGVLIVGASATGIQFASELQKSGRPVTLCVGEHVRMPRNYRGKDILWWMDRVGLLDENFRQVEDLQRARKLPSSQLVGTDDHRSLDLNALVEQGVELVGRLSDIHDGTALFSGSLNNVCKLADLKAGRLLRSIDEWADHQGADYGTNPPEPLLPTQLPVTPRLELKLGSGEIRSVIWACGFRPDYSWLDIPVLDRKGQLRHEGGIITEPGLYAMGLPFMRRRKSSFIYGAGDDARDISGHLAGYIQKSYQSQQVCMAKKPQTPAISYDYR